MKIFLKCFGCKRKSKDIRLNRNNVNSSGMKFAELVTPQNIIPNQVNSYTNNNENKTKEKNEVKSTEIDNNNNIEIKKDILITEEHETEKNKEIKDSLITEDSDKISNNNIIYSKLGLNLNPEIGFDEPLLKEDSPLLYNFEKELHFKFTRKNLVETFNKFWSLDKYKKVWEKDNLIIEIRDEGSDFNNEFNLIKISYRQLKKELNMSTDIKMIVDFFYEPSLRILWDNVLKNLEILEGDKKSNYIISTWAKSPVFFMSERESLEKRFLYKSPEENAYYIMSSSIPDELFPLKKDVIRITNYCNYYKIVDENEYIGLYSLNQTDFKMVIPQFLINVTLPTTTKNWMNDMEKFAKEVKYDINTSQLTYLNEKAEEKK